MKSFALITWPEMTYDHDGHRHAFDGYVVRISTPDDKAVVVVTKDHFPFSTEPEWEGRVIRYEVYGMTGFVGSRVYEGACQLTSQDAFDRHAQKVSA